MLRAVDHPKIVRLYGFYEEAGAFYLVSELLRGKDVFERTIELTSFPERLGRRLVANILEPLAYLHRSGIAHLDLKPENILLVYWGGWDGISDDARGLIRALLDPDPDARLAADQALRHAWFAPPRCVGTTWARSTRRAGIAEPGGLDGYEHLAEEEEEEGRLEVRPTKS
ncbi:serine/threonine kinase [Aureococcus anophagefferens]|nr:serine/threonine kinase [Aureococcus anophagefferens]